MLCDKCKSNIATYYSEISINGIIYEEHLCSECAGIKNKFSWDTLFNKWFGGLVLQDVLVGQDYGYLEGMVDRSVKSGDPIVDNALKSINIGASECCKEFSQKGNNLFKIRELRSKLEDAISCENYELASVIKKELDEYKKDNK